jgi:hypothetical protein
MSRIKSLRESFTRDKEASDTHTELATRLERLSSGNDSLSQQIAEAKAAAVAVDLRLDAFQESAMKKRLTLAEQAAELQMDMVLLWKQKAVYDALYDGLGGR